MIYLNFLRNELLYNFTVTYTRQKIIKSMLYQQFLTCIHFRGDTTHHKLVPPSVNM